MKIRVPAEQKGSGQVDEAPAPDVGGRPLPAIYIPLLGVLVVIAATYGLAFDDAYRLVSPLTRQTWRAQDAVTLITVPLLVWATRRRRTSSLGAHLFAVGILTWLTYDFAHLSFGTPFNAMFLVYVAILALAGFAMLDGLLRVDVVGAWPAFTRVPKRAAMWFLAVAGVGIGLLWLSEILAALPNGLPTNIHLSELPNPTWVIDLGWVIPTALAAASMLRRGLPAGPVIAGPILVMLAILSATMLTVVPFALAAGLGSDPVVKQQLIVFGVLFSVLGGVELWLLVRAGGRLGVALPTWRLHGWWPESG